MPKKSNRNLSAAQASFEGVGGWGGKRRRAGRKNQTGLVNHMKRESVDFKKPLHITMRLAVAKLNLRCGLVLVEFERCAKRARIFGLRVLHFSLQGDHLHLMVEAAVNSALAAGMRSLGASLGKALRKILGGRGAVFAGRYHLHVLKTPTEVRRALAYVLQNRAKHSRLIEHVDRYSSAPYFSKWVELYGSRLSPLLIGRRAAPLPGFLSSPVSWLARSGWMRGNAASAIG